MLCSARITVWAMTCSQPEEQRGSPRRSRRTAGLTVWRDVPVPFGQVDTGHQGDGDRLTEVTQHTGNGPPAVNVEVVGVRRSGAVREPRGGCLRRVAELQGSLSAGGAARRGCRRARPLQPCHHRPGLAGLSAGAADLTFTPT
jgi:hypothetical protein